MQAIIYKQHMQTMYNIQQQQIKIQYTHQIKKNYYNISTKLCHILGTYPGISPKL